MSELSNIYERLSSMEQKMATLMSNYASQMWVRDLLDPIKISQQDLAASQEQLTKRTEALYAAHEKFLTDEAVRKDEEHKAKIAALERQTFSAIAGNWARVAGYFSAIVAAIVVGGPPIAAFLQAVLHAQ